MSTLWKWAAVSSIVILILLSPVVAFLMIIAAEVLIDGLIEARTTAVGAVAVGVLGWVPFRKFWAFRDKAPRSEPELVSVETAIATPPV